MWLLNAEHRLGGLEDMSRAPIQYKDVVLPV